MFRTNLLFIFSLSIFVVSCSGPVEKESIFENAENTAYVEYLWCKNGPDMSQEAFTQMISEWNEILDGLETAVPMSVGLVPRTETDLYDGMWVLVWESKAQSEKGWQEWLDGPADDWT